MFFIHQCESWFAAVQSAVLICGNLSLFVAVWSRFLALAPSQSIKETKNSDLIILNNLRPVDILISGSVGDAELGEEWLVLRGEAARELNTPNQQQQNP